MTKKVLFILSILLTVSLVSGCVNDEKVADSNNNKEIEWDNNRAYNWSTAGEGPYNDAVTFANGSSPLYFIANGEMSGASISLTASSCFNIPDTADRNLI